jgi:hypothetical protein
LDDFTLHKLVLTRGKEEKMKELEGLEEFMKDFQENVRVLGDIQFPIEVSEIAMTTSHGRHLEQVGKWVSIRPCDTNKTYLGVYLGDLNAGPQVSWHAKTKILSVHPYKNPAIYVPDLKRVVWGMESWWGVIDKPEDLKKITDADIQNVWYVKALIELGEASIVTEEE